MFLKSKITLFLIIALAALGLVKTTWAGLGLSPSDWLEKDGIRGSHIEKTFTLSRGDPNEDLYFEAVVSGEIKDWLQIDKGLNFMMPKGAQQFPIKVTLDIPRNAEYKNYKGEIRLKSESKNEKAGGMGSSVLLNALIRIDLTVSNKKVLNYEVLQILIPKQEEGKPVNLILKIWNKGNLEAKPTKVNVAFFDKYKADKIEEKEITDFSQVKAVTPFSQGEIKLEIPFAFPKEQYWAKVQVFRDEKIIKAQEIVFEIVEKGSLSKGLASLTKGPFKYIILAIVIIILGLGTWLKMKKRKRKNNISGFSPRFMQK